MGLIRVAVMFSSNSYPLVIDKKSILERAADDLRPWVQLPPGPLFPIVQLRY
jgi:hypothetical protein